MQSADSDAACLGWGLRFCICSQQPGGVDRLSRETMLQVASWRHFGKQAPAFPGSSPALGPCPRERVGDREEKQTT